MNRYLAFAALITCMVAATGCSRRMTDFTVISTKNTVLAADGGAGKPVKGEDCVPVILVHLGEPSLKEAIDNAIESAGPGYDALVDGVVNHRYEYFFFGQDCWEVEGTAVPRATTAAM